MRDKKSSSSSFLLFYGSSRSSISVFVSLSVWGRILACLGRWITDLCMWEMTATVCMWTSSALWSGTPYNCDIHNLNINITVFLFYRLDMTWHEIKKKLKKNFPTKLHEYSQVLHHFLYIVTQTIKSKQCIYRSARGLCEISWLWYFTLMHCKGAANSWAATLTLAVSL